MSGVGAIKGAETCEAFGIEWPGRLFAFQIGGIEKLLSEPAVLLADEMGLGKTVQAIAALRVLRRRAAIRQAIVVCPAGLVLQWRRHARQWAPEMRISTVLGSADQRAAAWRVAADLYIASYESLRSDVWSRYPESPGERTWDVAILDEAQRIKNRHADIAVAAKRLHRARSWALTGTPVENRLDDLLSILEFVAPGQFDPAAMAVGLRRLLSRVQLRRLRKDVLHDLPPKLVSIVDMELAGAQQLAYRRAEEEGIVRLRSLGREIRISHVLELILRLKQICNFCPETGASAKLVDLRRRLEAVAAAGEKALVFSQFVEEPFGVRRLARDLAEFGPLSITGEAQPALRSARVAAFQSDPSRRVLILSLRAGGVGLNLTAASHVFHFDRWWNPALESQSEDRAHRIGQRRTVHVFGYLCADTIEERIDEILTEKRALFADIVDGVSARNLQRLDLDTLLRAVGATK